MEAQRSNCGNLNFQVQESRHPGAPMPPITEQIPRGKHILHHQHKFGGSEKNFPSASEKGDNSDEDDDLEIGGVTQNYLCPITLTLLEDPYTSYVCLPPVNGGPFWFFSFLSDMET
jgi:hypothetical protein